MARIAKGKRVEQIRRWLVAGTYSTIPDALDALGLRVEVSLDDIAAMPWDGQTDEHLFGKVLDERAATVSDLGAAMGHASINDDGKIVYSMADGWSGLEPLVAAFDGGQLIADPVRDTWKRRQQTAYAIHETGAIDYHPFKTVWYAERWCREHGCTLDTWTPTKD